MQTKDEMAGWHHRLDGHESEWTPGDGDGQGVLRFMESQRVGDDWATELNWTELNLTEQSNLWHSQESRNRCFSGTLFFFHDPKDVGNILSDSSAFYNSSLNIWKFTFTYCWSLAWRIFSITLLACEMSAVVPVTER